MQSPPEQPDGFTTEEGAETPETVETPESFSEADSESRAKLPFYHFDLVAQMHLQGTQLGNLVRSTPLARDAQGNLETSTVDNLKTMFKVASRMAPSPRLARRFDCMLGFLENY